MSGCLKILTIIIPMEIEGSLGTMKWFTPYHQWCYEDSSEIEVTCGGCADMYKEKIVKHYRVVEDEEDFQIPDFIMALENRVRSTGELSGRDWQEENLFIQPKDHKKEALEVFGIDIKAGETRADNGYDIWKKKSYPYRNTET